MTPRHVTAGVEVMAAMAAVAATEVVAASAGMEALVDCFLVVAETAAVTEDTAPMAATVPMEGMDRTAAMAAVAVHTMPTARNTRPDITRMQQPLSRRRLLK
jgi:hypothetical protein